MREEPIFPFADNAKRPILEVPISELEEIRERLERILREARILDAEEKDGYFLDQVGWLGLYADVMHEQGVQVSYTTDGQNGAEARETYDLKEQIPPLMKLEMNLAYLDSFLNFQKYGWSTDPDSLMKHALAFELINNIFGKFVRLPEWIQPGKSLENEVVLEGGRKLRTYQDLLDLTEKVFSQLEKYDITKARACAIKDDMELDTGDVNMYLLPVYIELRKLGVPHELLHE